MILSSMDDLRLTPAIDPPRVAVALCGDMRHDLESIVKYGDFLAALKRKFPIVDVYDANLRGFQRLLNAALVWHPDIKKWRARTHKSVDAFISRSRGAVRWSDRLQGQADVLLQVGVLFDSGWNNNPLPRVIYTDYTAHMSAGRPDAGRSPFSGATLSRWLALERHALVSAAHVCVRSNAVKQSFVRDYSISADHITVVGGGLNLSHLPPLHAPSADRPPTALFIGTDFYRKGGDLTLKAFALTRAVLPNAQLIMVSQDAIPSELPRKGVKVLSPVWDRKRFLELYSLADVFVLPSRLETWGDVILEAMAFGLPCIGVTGQPMEEIIRHGETGLLVAPEDVDALASALVKLLAHPDLSRRMGQAGRQLVAREFMWSHVVDRMAPILESAARLG